MNDYYQFGRHQPKKRKIGKILKIVAFIILMLGIFGWHKYSQYQYYISTPVDPTDTANASLLIKAKDTPAIIAKKLADKDLILDQESFNWYVRFNNFDRKIVAGRFLLNKSMTIPKVVEKIIDRTQGEQVLTIPEGSTIRDIDQKLVNLDLIHEGEFVKATKDFNNYAKYPFLDENKIKALPYPLEGFLFPDTYFINPNDFSNENLISLMLNDFQKRVPDELLKRSSTASTNSDAEKKSPKNLLEIITMASIVEKEVNTDKDRPIVAGILWKRLESNWQIGADATLLYLKDDRKISAEDLKEDSLYNTRKNTGLPPGPIGNPGLKTIMAAFQPEESPYFYYLTKPGTGEVVYAKTNDEHNQNRAKYLN